MAVCVLLFAGCEIAEKGIRCERTTLNGLETCRYTTSTNARGIAQVDVELDSADAALMITGASDSLLAFETIYNADGDRVLYWEDWIDDQGLTGAFYVESNESTINWPVRAEDAPLEPGKWTFELAAIDNNVFDVNNEDIDITVQVHEDSDFETGTMFIEIVYAQGVGDNSTVVEATEAAVEVWREIYGNIGITLEISYRTDPNLDATLTDLSEGGSDAIAEQSAAGDDTDITVLIGENIGELGGVYGISGGIPGSLVSTSRSAAVISWLPSAGLDATFDAQELRIYGETLAQEARHYAGLLPPVEQGWDGWESLSDQVDGSRAGVGEPDRGRN